jgi:K+-sensing histidine kinase KdpD
MIKGSSEIDLDIPAIAEQIPADKAWLAETQRLLNIKGFIGAGLKQKEAVASEVDPPSAFFFVLSAALAAASLSVLMHNFVGGLEHENYLFFMFAVMATAMVFGRLPAIILSIVSLFAYNLLIVPPEWNFTLPDQHEWIHFAVDLVISLVGPWALRQIVRLSKICRRVTLEEA